MLLILDGNSWYHVAGALGKIDLYDEKKKSIFDRYLIKFLKEIK